MLAFEFELGEGAVAKRLSDFLIRAYPAQHVSSLSHRMFKTPESCAACHKQFIDEELQEQPGRRSRVFRLGSGRVGSTSRRARDSPAAARR